MATLALVIGIAALLGYSRAQTTNEYVWSSFAFVLHGEATPIMADNPRTLTPIGAQQLYAQGQIFRARYLNSNLTGEENAVTVHTGLQGLQVNAIDNSQLSLSSSTDEYTTASAFAFMQGLYPPITEAFAAGAGGMEAAELANGSLVNYPLEGYQYPNIQTSSQVDPGSVWIEGNAACTEYQKSNLGLRRDPVVNSIFNSTLGFYQSLWQKLFHSVIPRTMANFFYAYDLYDYALYQYNHNTSAASVLNKVDLVVLGDWAAIQQRDMNGNLSASGLTQGDMIRAVAGRTMAGKAVLLLSSNIDNAGTGNKLNLMFGSYEPFIAFFALAGLIDGASSQVFEPVPSPGAAMVFELFSVGGDGSEYPSSTDELWVRFLYRNGTDPAAPFAEYALFGDGNSQSRMRWSEFISEMGGISVSDLSTWCNLCSAVSLWCWGLEANAGSNGDSSYSTTSSAVNNEIGPVVAGVIGAVAAFAFALLVILAAVVLGRVRVYRAGGKNRRNRFLGGFKGPEKKASDADVAYASNSGVRHERTGSWELRSGGKAADNGVEEGVVETTPETAVGATVSKDFAPSWQVDDDDAISEIHHEPVNPREF